MQRLMRFRLIFIKFKSKQKDECYDGDSCINNEKLPYC